MSSGRKQTAQQHHTGDTGEGKKSKIKHRNKHATHASLRASLRGLASRWNGEVYAHSHQPKNNSTTTQTQSGDRHRGRIRVGRKLNEKRKKTTLHSPRIIKTRPSSASPQKKVERHETERPSQGSPNRGRFVLCFYLCACLKVCVQRK